MRYTCTNSSWIIICCLTIRLVRSESIPLLKAALPSWTKVRAPSTWNYDMFVLYLYNLLSFSCISSLAKWTFSSPFHLPIKSMKVKRKYYKLLFSFYFFVCLSSRFTGKLRFMLYAPISHRYGSVCAFRYFLTHSQNSVMFFLYVDTSSSHYFFSMIAF